MVWNDPRVSDASDQFHYLGQDLRRAVNGRWWRWIGILFQPGILSIIGYRLSRASFLALGAPYGAVHLVLRPIHMVLRPFSSGLELHYSADIGPGLLILHPSLGVVVSGSAVIGRDLTLTGGNWIGNGRGLVVGDRVNLGANAVILGPGSVGGDVVVGAGSILIGDAPEGATMVGAPARPLDRREAATEQLSPS
jgi:serine acetyltransferase